MRKCPNCKNKVSKGMNFCDQCGTVLQKNKRIFTGKLCAFVVCIAVIAVSMTALIYFNMEISESPEGVMYVKDNEIFYNNLKKNHSVQLTSKFVYDMDVSDTEDMTEREYSDELTDAIEYGSLLSQNGKIVFYPGKVDEESEVMSLYCRKVDTSDEKTVKIGSDILGYQINQDATVVVFVKENEQLYRYDVNSDKTEKIGDDIRFYQMSDDGQKLLYVNKKGMYQKKTDGEIEKLDGDINQICYVNGDLSKLVYMKDDDVYQKTDGMDKVKIASDVERVLKVYDTGEMYYFKSDPVSFKLTDFIWDDMEEEDKNAEWPATVEPPVWWDYDTEEEYDQAYALYEEEKDRYDQMYEAYMKKMERDELRNQISEIEMGGDGYTLYYFNGMTEMKLEEQVSYAGSFFAQDVPVMAYRVYNLGRSNQIKLSDIESVESIQDQIRSSRTSFTERTVAVGGVTEKIEQNSDSNLVISDDGKILYYVDDIPEEESAGELYEIEIVDGKLQKAVLYDSDVYTEMRIPAYVWNEKYTYTILEDDEHLIYVKDYQEDSDCGDLYINKNKIDYDVCISNSLYDKESGKVIYCADWDAEDECGALKLYIDGNSEKIADDVHDFDVLQNGDILYICNYSLRSGEGELYLYENGKNKKIDGAVMGIIKYNHTLRQRENLNDLCAGNKFKMVMHK